MGKLGMTENGAHARMTQRAALIKKGKESYHRDYARARAMGFSARELPFAAQILGLSAAFGSETPPREQIRQRIRAQHPFLFEEKVA